jgi:hypothetical protein
MEQRDLLFAITKIVYLSLTIPIMLLVNNIRFKSCLIICVYHLLNASLALSQNIIVQPYLQDAEAGSMTIMWETDAVGQGYVHWAISPFNLTDTVLSWDQTGGGTSRIHTATINGLSQKTKYYYQISTQSGNTSALYHFVTPPQKNSDAAVQMIAISDMQRDGGNPDIFRQIVEDGMMPTIQSELSDDLASLEAILIPGDLVATGGNYSQWKDHFFNPSDSLTPFVPLYPVPGNHEYINNGLPNFLKYFSLPVNGPAGLEEECWYKDLSNVRIIGLNSNSPGEYKFLQLEWLDAVLQQACSDPDIDFVFAQLHHPYKSELWLPGESDFTGDVIQRLEAFTTSCAKGSVHFFGHTHGYSRGQSRDHQHLWINVATAGGNIDYWGEFANADYDEFTKSQDEYGFVLIEAEAGDDPELRIRRFSRGDEFNVKNNEVTDEFRLRQHEYPPSKPLAIFPDMDTLESQCVVLKASDFHDPGDIHQASHWQIAEDCDFANAVVEESWKQFENWYFEVDLQAGDDLTDEAFDQLIANQNYCWRVRYRDQYLKWSDWSDPRPFHTKSTGVDLTGNVVSNNGAENGINGWVGDIESILSNECNSVPAYQGASLFCVGGICANESAVGYAHQVFDMSAHAADISQGNVSILYSAYMRDFSGADVPEIYIEFYDDQSVLIETTTSLSNANATWTQKSNLALVPSNAVEARITLKGTRNAGTDNDSYFDEIFAKLTISPDCAPCFTAETGPFVDADEDGYCQDLDCDDQDESIYPGALEICDGKDNNCDGIVDGGEIVTWNGEGDGISWSDGDNWDQDMVPLKCQHVIINTSDSIVIKSNPTIKSLFLGEDAILQLIPDSELNIDGDNSNAHISAKVHGKLIIQGRCNIMDSQNQGMQVFGMLINQGRLYINLVAIESLNVELGGVFINESVLEAGFE